MFALSIWCEVDILSECGNFFREIASVGFAWPNIPKPLEANQSLLQAQQTETEKHWNSNKPSTVSVTSTHSTGSSSLTLH